MSEKHTKHARLTKPAYGQFHRREWAIVGTPCERIKELAFHLIDRLSEQYRFAYIDADHPGAEVEAAAGRPPHSAMAYGAHLEYTDKITHHRFDFEGKPGQFQYRWWCHEADAVLVNGNHFPAARQIVVVDPKKEASLKKRQSQLTDVQLILLADDVQEIFPWLREHLEDVANIPVLRLSDTARIAEWLGEQLALSRPPLYGLVLAGGKSQRMGRDKGLIDYHGKPQREYSADLLTHFCERTFLSCRPDQVAEMGSGYPAIADTFAGLGPFGAILSAFREYPDHAWLVIATDLPLLDQTALAQLVAKRNISKVATAFHSPVTGFPEPLIAVWEPRSYPVLLQFLSQGYSCPRKALINSDIELVEAANPEVLKNVNHPEELKAVREKLKG